MTANINNIRRKACICFDSLCSVLNENIRDGKITIDCEDIQEHMDDLRHLILVLAMCYEKDNPEFIDVFEELYPNKTDTMKLFNDIEQ